MKDPVEKPQKKEEQDELELEHMLEELLQVLKSTGYELDKSDILYSRRCRGQVTRIIEWMLMHNYVDDKMALDDDESCDVVYDESCYVVPSNDDIRLLDYSSHAVVSSNDGMRVLDYSSSSDGAASNDDISVLRRAISHLAESIRGSGCQLLPRRHLFYSLDGVRISRHGPSYVCWEEVTKLRRSDFSSMWLCNEASSIDSEARNVISLLYSRCTDFPLIRNRYGSPWTPGGVEQPDFGPNTFRDKYVLVCCINVPAAFAFDGIQSLFSLCHELSSLERGDIEIVIVARIHILCDAPEIFKHVLKELPSSCFVVQYDDWERRERIYKQLGFGGEEFQCFVYNTDGFFLNSFCADGFENPYGAEAFPFTKDMVEKVHRERVALRQGGSLEELLRPSYYQQDVVVYEFNQTRGPKWRISQVIENKHVGLYVCCNGDLIPRLHELYEQCKKRNEEFEIVVLYHPLQSGMDPEMFKEEIDGLLQKQQIRGWWCLPFNNSVSLRFWGLTKDYDCGECSFEHELEDRLIIVGPDGKILDMYGADVIKTRGIDDTYPFTRAAFVEKRMREMRREKRLLESLLGAQLFRGDDPAHVISGKALLNKKVIIYMGVALKYSANGIKYDFQGLLSQYEEMKKDVGDEFEVVFVEFPIPYLPGAVDAGVFREMPWYIHCPLDGTYTALSKQLMVIVGRAQTLVGFGEDGRIRSAKPLQKLEKTAGLCLDDTLFDDLYLFHGFDGYCVI